jgi:hypothetical protein
LMKTTLAMSKNGLKLIINRGTLHPGISHRFQSAGNRGTSLTLAELGHGIYRAFIQDRRQQRRKFVDEIKMHIPVMPITSVSVTISLHV